MNELFCGKKNDKPLIITIYIKSLQGNLIKSCLSYITNRFYFKDFACLKFIIVEKRVDCECLNIIIVHLYNK